VTLTDTRPRVLAALALLCTLLALAPAVADAQAPDPLDRGPYEPATVGQYKLGTVDLQEPNAAGGAPTGSAAAATLQIRGSLYYPADRTTPSPVIILVHGNHTNCDTGTSPVCTVFKRNDRGYAYLGENLATWGYTTASIDQDQLMAFQDGAQGKGMHQRRRLIAATLDALYAANETGLANDENTNVGDLLRGRLDLTRIGLMGHSRGGDAVTSFIDYNRTRPAPGRRYPLRGVISLAPVDYERRAPYGTPYMTILPYCDGDVSNLQGARFFERSQYIQPGDPFPRIQVSVHGTNHNWYNTVWSADGQDSNNGDDACSIASPNNIRLSGGLSNRPATGNPGPDDGWVDGGTYTRNNRGSGDPALMGDQEKVGLALMSSFFRRYVGGEVAFDEYMTGERDAAGQTELPASACPSLVITGPSGSGTNGPRLGCGERIMTSYFAPPAERVDVLAPGTDNPFVSELGTSVAASGFASPYLAGGGVDPLPAPTASGVDWCNPEPLDFAPGELGISGLPSALKPCPLPGPGALGHQADVREDAPINQSYGLQLALAWESPAMFSIRIPSGRGDVSGLKALAMGAAVNFFDPRNPARTPEALWNPAATTQDFTIALVDADGVEGTVAAASQRYGNALHQTPGTTTTKVHVVLNQLRVPLADFAAQGVDLTKVRKLELRFGEGGKPSFGSIQLADVRFQESVDGPTVLTDTFATAEPTAAASPEPLPDTTGLAGSTVTAPAEACTDTVQPKASIDAVERTGRRLRIAGRATDAGCAAAATAGSVRSVRVSLAKPGGAKRCRFVRPNGRLSRPVSCSQELALVAKGARRWSVSLNHRLPAGRYRLVVRVLDGSGNANTIRRPVNIG
jgi:hypothetical protein